MIKGKRNPAIRKYHLEHGVVISNSPMVHCPEYCPFEVANCFKYCSSKELLQRECIIEQPIMWKGDKAYAKS